MLQPFNVGKRLNAQTLGRLGRLGGAFSHSALSERIKYLIKKGLSHFFNATAFDLGISYVILSIASLLGFVFVIPSLLH